ncbi:MAG: hypothetical protein KAH09_04540 [Desulfobacula sp.]|nr:hypothetical protein [Desulfobacula sp.]
MMYETLPLSVVEASHLIGSMVGLLLLFMARAVRLRIDAAYFGILVLLAAGGIASLLKGFDWQPRYLAAPALTAPAVLLSVTGMIAGNWKRVFVK